MLFGENLGTRSCSVVEPTGKCQKNAGLSGTQARDLHGTSTVRRTHGELRRRTARRRCAVLSVHQTARSTGVAEKILGRSCEARVAARRGAARVAGCGRWLEVHSKGGESEIKWVVLVTF